MQPLPSAAPPLPNPRSLATLLGATVMTLVCLIGLWVGDRRLLLEDGHSVIAPTTGLIILTLGLELLLLQWNPPWRLLRAQAAIVCTFITLLVLSQLLLKVISGTEILPWDNWLLPEVAGARGMRPTPLSTASCISLLLILLSLAPRVAGPRPGTGLLRAAQFANTTAIGLSLFHLFCALLGISPLVIGVLLTGTLPSHCALLLLALATAGSNQLWSTSRTLLFGREGHDAQAPVKAELRRENHLLAGLLVLSTTALLVLALSLRFEYRTNTDEITNNLRAVARLKASELENWLQERVTDAKWHADSPLGRMSGDRHASMKDSLGVMSQSLEDFRGTNGYVAMIHCNAVGEVLFSTSAVDDLVTEDLLAKARNGTEPRLIGFYAARGRSLLACAAPRPATDGQPAGDFVLLIIDPRRDLLPMMTRWPSSEASGRSFLVEARDHEILEFVSPGAEDQNSPDVVCPQAADLLCKAATIADPLQPLLEGKDREGLQRLGVAVPVKGTPWRLVATISSEAGYADLRGRMMHQVLDYLVLAALLVGGMGILWRLRQERSHARELETRQEKDALTKRLGVLMQQVNDSIFIFDQNMRIIEANHRAVRMYGYELGELLGMKVHQLRAAEATASIDLDFHAAKTRQGVIFSTTHRRKDGTTLPVEVSARSVELEGRQLVISTIRDNSERQAQLHEIEDLNRFFLVISRINQAILRQKTRRDLFATLCTILVETGQFKIAWIGLFDPGTRLLSPIAVSGDEYGYVRAIHISTDPSVPEGLGPSGTALREQQPVVCNDFMATPSTAPWRDEAARSGIRSSIALPLRQEGRIVGMLNVYAREVNFFDPQKVKLLEKAANDISFAMDLLASNERRHLTEAALVASERRLSFLLSATPAIIYSLKAGGSFATTFISNNVQAILGHPPAAFTQTPSFWLENIHPDDLKAATEAVSSTKQGESTLRSYRFRHADGSYRWMRDAMRAVLDEHGTLTEYVGYWADITESMQAAEALRNSRDRLAKAEQMASLGNWELDHLTGKLTWSDELYRIFEIGEGSTDASREAMLTRVHPDDRSQALEIFRNGVLHGERFSTSFRLLFPDGRIKFLVESGESFRDPNGRLLRSVGAIQDLTVRRQTELELQELVKQLRVLHEVALTLDAPDKSLDEIVALVTEKLPRAMRRPEGTRVSVTVHDCTRSSGNRDAMTEKYHTPISINGREAGCITVWQSPGPTGSHSPLISQEEETVESVARSLGMGLGARESLATIRSISAELERKVQERTAELARRNREIQGLLNAIPDLVLRIRSDGCIVDVQQAHDSSALLSLAAAKGSKTAMSADNPLIPLCLETGLEALRSERTVTREQLIPLPSGSVAVEFRGAPIDAEESVVFVRDITTRKQIEQEMEAMLEKERQVSELKSRFISVTSHEFRTPMATTMGAVEILRNHADKLSASKREELYTRITDALHRMTTMLDDVLTLSRLGASRIPVQITEVDLGGVVRDIVDEVRLGDQESHAWNLRLPDGPQACEADAHLLHGILTNLLSNACRYSPPGTAITVELLRGTERFDLAVEDQGIGIPEKDWQRIFEPFERGGNVGGIKGSGLGLNIVKGMAELLGGRVTIERSSGSGSRFVVSLPRHQPSPPPQA